MYTLTYYVERTTQYIGETEMTPQPQWKLLANLGDVNPLDYGGYFVYRDETGVYPEEAELLELDSPDNDNSNYTVYRFILERCSFVNGVLSDNKFHPECSAWFANPDRKGDKYTVLGDIASFTGQDASELIDDICSDDAIRRAMVWQSIGRYNGFDNLDSYPLKLTKEEAEARYAEFA